MHTKGLKYLYKSLIAAITEKNSLTSDQESCVGCQLGIQASAD